MKAYSWKSCHGRYLDNVAPLSSGTYINRRIFLCAKRYMHAAHTYTLSNSLIPHLGVVYSNNCKHDYMHGRYMHADHAIVMISFITIAMCITINTTMPIIILFFLQLAKSYKCKMAFFLHHTISMWAKLGRWQMENDNIPHEQLWKC